MSEDDRAAAASAFNEARPEPALTGSPWLPASRFALYYAPSRGSPWWEAGCRWLGRDPERGTVLVPPRVPALAARGQDVVALSRAPARYGWHGTLVAPSRCAPGITPDDVLHEALEWAQHHKSFELPVEAALLGRFVALRPATASGAASIAAVAADALQTLACLRAVAIEQETRRRLESDLTARQRELLERWGYPYVLDEFRFHMTLSDSIDDDEDRAALLAWWHECAPRLGPLHVDGAALFVEPEPGAPFVLWARLPFGGRG
jgi:putative phosphonate metabolism protein